MESSNKSSNVTYPNHFFLPTEPAPFPSEGSSKSWDQGNNVYYKSLLKVVTFIKPQL